MFRSRYEIDDEKCTSIDQEEISGKVSKSYVIESS